MCVLITSKSVQLSYGTYIYTLRKRFALRDAAQTSSDTIKALAHIALFPSACPPIEDESRCRLCVHTATKLLVRNHSSLRKQIISVRIRKPRICLHNHYNRRIQSHPSLQLRMNGRRCGSISENHCITYFCCFLLIMTHIQC